MNFSSYDTLAFLTGTGAATAATGGQLINSAVLVAFIVLLTKVFEWRIKANARRKQTAFEQEMVNTKKQLANSLTENNRLLRKIAGEEPLLLQGEQPVTVQVTFQDVKTPTQS